MRCGSKGGKKKKDKWRIKIRRKEKERKGGIEFLRKKKKVLKGDREIREGRGTNITAIIEADNVNKSVDGRKSVIFI